MLKIVIFRISETKSKGLILFIRISGSVAKCSVYHLIYANYLILMQGEESKLPPSLTAHKIANLPPYLLKKSCNFTPVTIFNYVITSGQSKKHKSLIFSRSLNLSQFQKLKNEVKNV